MDTHDILNLFLILGVITITGCIVFVSYFFIQALKSVTSLAEHLKETAANFKDKMGLKALAVAAPSILLALISKFFKRGGEKYGK